MPRRPAAYPPAYREQIIALAREGRPAKELAREFEPSEEAIRNWICQAEADRGERPGAVTSEERVELTRLRGENRQLRVERDILGKAAAWFARETGTIDLVRARGGRLHRHLSPQSGGGTIRLWTGGDS